jgi:hypothetical protein
MIRFETHSTSITPELYSVPARGKDLAANRDLYSICPQGQKVVIVVYLDRGTIVDPGTMTCATQY